MQIVITIFAAVFVLFLPGFVLSYVFFGKQTIDSIERLALSFALSIAVVPLVVFYTNLLGIRISVQTVIIQVVLVILIAVLIIVGKQIKKSRIK